MKFTTILFGLACIIAAVAAPAAFAANLSAGAVGVFLLGSVAQANTITAATIPPRLIGTPVAVVAQRSDPPPRRYAVRGGHVEFVYRGQNVISRFYPA